MNTQQEVERVKLLTLNDNKNNKQSYMLSQTLLGKGKYGKVYRATNLNDQSKVFAVKTIKFDNQKIKNDYKKQIQIIKHLPQSLNLVKIHPYHLQSNNNFYIFQQYCDGGNLFQLRLKRKNQPFTQDQIYNLFYQVVKGLLDLRKSNIYHQDIKPQNILIKNNIYKFTDFGISQLQTNTIQASQIRRGTLTYMPPQKLKGTTFIPTSKTQIYSLGVTLFQIIFGYHPYLCKNPTDYKQYLKMLQESNLKPIQQLQQRFPSRTLCSNKFIRIILKMIQLNQSKRLTIQQLQDYLKNTQPFKSMVITKQQPKPKRHRPIKYQTTSHSNVVMRSQGDLGQLIQSHSLKFNQKIHNIDELYKISLELLRDCTNYFQQGIAICKKSTINQFKQLQLQSTLSLNNIPKITQIQFLTLFFLQKIFTQFQKLANNYIFQSDIENNLGTQVCEDKQFISNQFLKCYIDLQLQNKKQIWTTLKQQSPQFIKIPIKQSTKIYQLINCVKVNYKFDLLSILFIKQLPHILIFLKYILDYMYQQNYKKILQLISSQQYIQILDSIKNYKILGNQKIKAIYHAFQQSIKGHQIIQDVESNSDQFQVLDLNDLL